MSRLVEQVDETLGDLHEKGGEEEERSQEESSEDDEEVLGVDG